MNRSDASRYRLLAAALVLSLCAAQPLFASVGDPVALSAQATENGEGREKLAAEIREKARKDAERGDQAENAQGLQLLFGRAAEKEGLDLRWVVEVYEQAFDEARSAPRPWWEELRPQAGWIAAAVAVLLLLLKDILKESLGKAFKALREGIYRRLAGTPALRRLALRRYRRALVRKYERLKIAFRPDRPLEMREVFVPLKVSGGRENEQVDAYTSMARHHRLMVTGAPGSGKSMLMQNLALSYAEGRRVDPAGDRVPVLLELGRLGEASPAIGKELEEVFRRHDFPRARGFVQKALEKGRMLVLFDGLDEVASEARPAVVAAIRDFLETYAECPAVLTCRTAVYNQEFADSVDATLEIVEFSDRQIREFLASWERDMPAEKSVEQLLRTLRDRPRIMALARNPLLLTIIAYLYTDTEFVLPHSRAEFYGQATQVLLDQWKRERNLFKAIQKKLVLQHLAHFLQVHAGEEEADRRSLTLEEALAQVGQVLPRLNLAADRATPLLDEIVERSGLLLAIDGGERYQFAHLTLQEYYAAAELESRPEELLERFEQDPAAWREIVKLWCGLGPDATEVVRRIHARDTLLAAECLADAQKIDPELSRQIVEELQKRFAEQGESGDEVRRALATLAADARPRGRAVLEFLMEKAGRIDLASYSAAVRALAMTNLPKAAERLAELDPKPQSIRDAMARMGSLIVPHLAEQVKNPENPHALKLVEVRRDRHA